MPYVRTYVTSLKKKKKKKLPKREISLTRFVGIQSNIRWFYWGNFHLRSNIFRVVSLFLSHPLSLSLSALLPASSAIPEFDATSAIRYRPRKSDCSLWSRNNRGRRCIAVAGRNSFANREREKNRRDVERERKREKSAGCATDRRRKRGRR